MSWLVIFSFSSSNASWCSFSHFYSFFYLSLLRDFAIWLKFFYESLVKVCKPQEAFNFFYFGWGFLFLTVFTLLFSIYTSPHSTTTSRIRISLILKSHFDYLKHRLCFSFIFKNKIVLSSNSLVLVGITKSLM